MPTERLGFLVAAVGMVAAMLISPFSVPAGWDKAAHFAAFSALTFCLWRATAGSMPALAILGAICFGALDEWRQAYLPERVSDAQDFLADVAAVVATGALLFVQRKLVCAESSPR
jgi:VanZ family protein